MHKIIFIFLFALVSTASLLAQNSASADQGPGGSIALSPARFELEMKPGTETTVVVNLDYRSPVSSNSPTRIVASLNDWTISRDGRVEYFPANSRKDSASSWLIYSPGEAAVTPGSMHQIRVTVSVPPNAPPGDHLTALIVEQRPENLKNAQNSRQMVVRYRMAAVFYIKVPGLTRKGNFEDLYAEHTSGGIVVTPVLKNLGNSVIRPEASLLVEDQNGKTVAALSNFETLPILGRAETAQPLTITERLPQGKYAVKFHIDFKDGQPPVEGVTELVIKTPPQIASSGTSPKNP